MTVLRRMGLMGALVLGSVGVRASAADSQDATLDSTVRLMRRTMTVLKTTAMSGNEEASQIITALRSSKDKALLPLFDRLRESKSEDNRLFGSVAGAIMAKDAKRIDMSMMLASTNPVLVGAALASLIDSGVMTTEQLQRIVNESPDSANRVMAAGELNHRKELKERSVLKDLMKDSKDMVRYYAAVTMLDSSDAAERTAALEALNGLSDKHLLRNLEVEALMLVRAQKEDVKAAIPWAARIAADDKSDEGLRYTAVAAVLALKGPEGARLLADMISKQRETIQQVKLGLIAIEYADQLKPAMLDPLMKSRSTLVLAIAAVARKAADGGDSTAGVVELIKAAHPIVLNWALAFAERTDPDRQLTIRTALVNQSTIVDKMRGEDFRRASDAAQRILDDDGAAGRKTIMSLLRSDNRAVVEATLAGIYRAKAENQAELVLPIWDGLTKTTSTEAAANYAALILAREGRQEPKDWFPGMVAGGTVQMPGFRVLAGWYYATLKGQEGELLRAVLAE